MDLNFNEPLAFRMRPETLDEFVGQRHLLGENKILRKMIENDKISSMIFWGPPGVGKTTLAKIISKKTKLNFLNFSAVSSGIKDIKKNLDDIEKNKLFNRKTIIFIDEIHRFNKAQQDIFLPFVEDGSIILIGATTENPSFEVNNALLSRIRVFVLKELDKKDIFVLLKRAILSKKGFGNIKIKIKDEDLIKIASFSNGDARFALSLFENIILNFDEKNNVFNITDDIIKECLTKKSFLYDKNGEEHYNYISALHKSMRNSDPDASLYWLARMLESGEDPLYIARRIVRFSSEDIGLSDTNALNVAINVYNACHYLGMPECNVHLAEAVIYMSIAPKSNACDIAYRNAAFEAKNTASLSVPMQIRNAPIKLMKNLGYGKNYEYAHDYKEKLTSMSCLPDFLKNKIYYFPTEEGNEIKFKNRLEKIKEWKKRNKK